MAVSSAAEARSIAERHLDNMRPRIGVEIATVEPTEYPTCWVVGWNTVAFIQTREVGHALAGNGPVIVNRRTGVARWGVSALPIEEQLDAD